MSKPSAWLREYGRPTFLAWDFKLGVLAGGVVGAAAGASEAIRDSAVIVLAAEAALGAALLAVALTALAILVGLLDDRFLRVLEVVPGGMRAAVAPYRTIAAVGALTTIVSVVGMLASVVGPWPVDAIAMGVAAALSIWGTWGTVQLVTLTAFFGVQRGDLLGIPRAAEREVAKARGQRAVGQ